MSQVRAPSSQDETRAPAQRWPAVFRDTASIVVVSVLLAGVSNQGRATPMPWVRREPYDILVPCPETLGSAEGVESGAIPGGERVLLVDARTRAEFDAWHVPQAQAIPYDYLAPVDAAVVRTIASSGVREVVVYGDGDDPDSGEQLARELAGRGIRNVRYVRGGAKAIRGTERRPASVSSGHEDARGGASHGPRAAGGTGQAPAGEGGPP